MIEALELFLSHSFLRRALLAAMLIALVSSILGVYVVLRRMALIGDGLAHVSLAGVSLGLMLGVYPLALGLAAAVLGGLAIHFLMARDIVKSDAAIGIIFTGGLAVGLLVISAGAGFGTDAQAYLFGNLLAVTDVDVLVVVALAAALLALIVLLHKELFYITLSPEAARLSGVPVRAMEVLFTVMTAIAVIVTVRIVGVLLVSALLIAPAAAALQVARGFRMTLVVALVFGEIAVVVGVLAAATWGIATGASIAVAAIVLFLVAAVVGKLAPALAVK